MYRSCTGGSKKLNLPTPIILTCPQYQSPFSRRPAKVEKGLTSYDPVTQRALKDCPSKPGLTIILIHTSLDPSSQDHTHPHCAAFSVKGACGRFPPRNIQKNLHVLPGFSGNKHSAGDWSYIQQVIGVTVPYLLEPTNPQIHPPHNYSQRLVHLDCAS